VRNAVGQIQERGEGCGTLLDRRFATTWPMTV
jgi:hypothetical protein